MKGTSPLLILISLADSALLLVLLVVLSLPPHPLGLLPWAGVLAGLNAVILSYGLNALEPGLRRALRWIGGGSALVLALLALVKMAI